MSRRSRGVYPLVTSPQLPEVLEDLFGRPVVARIDLRQLAVRVDDGGPKIVRDVARVAERTIDRHSKTRGELIHLVAIAGEERPAGEVGVKTSGVLLQDRWRIGRRIETHGDEVHVLERRIRLQRFLKRREVSIHEGA